MKRIVSILSCAFVLVGCDSDVALRSPVVIDNLLKPLRVGALMCDYHAVPEYDTATIFIRVESSEADFKKWQSVHQLVSTPSSSISTAVMPRIDGSEKTEAPWWNPPPIEKSEEYNGRINDYTVHALFDDRFIYIHAQK